jgi:hypothetical protein
MTEAEQIMKRCQIGTHNYNEANNLHADCYRVIGKLLAEKSMREVQRLGQEIEQESGTLHIDRLNQWLDASLKAKAAQRKPLTDEQIFACENSVPDEIVSDRDWCIHFARAIEAKIKENT